MEKKFYERVASLTGLEAAQLEKLALGELIQNVILPDICFKDPRHVSEEFVIFMTEFGFEIYKQTPLHGEALYDLVLQSLFLDGSIFSLPCIYKDPCLQMDQIYGIRPIGKSEFAFLKAQAPHLLARKESSNLLFMHMEKIVFELLENITPEGKLLKKNLCKDGVTPQELRKFAEEMANIGLGFYKTYIHFATPDKWEIWPEFFLEHQKEIKWSDFAERISFGAYILKGRKCKRMLQDYVTNKKGSV